MERILITGATGFIGSFIVEEALRRDMEVWAAVRPNGRGLQSDVDSLKAKNLHTILLDLDSESQMECKLQDLTFDYVVHAAGATKALNAETFYRVNTEGTKHLVNVLQTLPPPSLSGREQNGQIASTVPKRLVFLSSLSVMGPVRDKLPYEEIKDTDTPEPNTAYGKSKLAAEMWLRDNCKMPYTILRPTGVYGPREKDYKVMIDSIRRGLDVAVGGGKQDLTFVYVSDVVNAVFQAMQSPKAEGKAYFLSDGEVYSSRDFSDYIIEALRQRSGQAHGKKRVLRPVFPLGVLKAVCAVSDVMMHLTGRLSTLNNDHYNILKQRNWRCDIRPAMEDFSYIPQIPLKQGIRLTIKE